MGADMLTAYITTTETNPEKLNWDAAYAALSAVTDPEAFEFGDPESEVCALLEHTDDRDVFTADGALDIEVLRDAGAAALANLRQALSSRETDILTLGGYTAFISGGLSWGDTPTDAVDAIWTAYRLPLAVLHAAGLAIDVSDVSNRRTAYRAEIDGEYGIIDGTVRILDAATGEEVLMWDSTEWTEDPGLMYVIANAIETAHSDPELFTSRLPADKR